MKSIIRIKNVIFSRQDFEEAFVEKTFYDDCGAILHLETCHNHHFIKFHSEKEAQDVLESLFSALDA